MKINVSTFSELLKLVKGIESDLKSELEENNFWEMYNDFSTIYHNYWEHTKDIVSKPEEVKKYLNIQRGTHMADSEREYTHVDFLKDDNGDFYYCDELGNRLKGVNKVNGFYYLFGTVDGVLKVEWQTPNDKRYYYSPKDGNPVFGFIKYHGKFYYVDYDKGKIVSETITIDGLDYTFDENGVLTSDVNVDVKDKLVTLESIGVLHLYAENNYLKVADCVGKYWIDSDGNKQGEIHGDLEGNQATKECSFAGGFNCLATNICTFAIGNYATASGNTSASIGQNTEATGDYSFAANYFTKASGLASFSEGYQTIASGDYSHAEGHGTTASGDPSHTEGYNTQASGTCSHAEGGGCIASGDHSHAEGWKTEASGAEAHAEGSDCIASGLWSHAEGRNTKASGDHSHAEGECTIAAGSCQHASGKYNLEDVDNKYAFIIGNGKVDTEKKELIRSNAFAIDWNGKIYIGNDTTGVDLTQKVAAIFVNAATGSDTENNGINLSPVQTLKRAVQLTQYVRKAVIYLAAGEFTAMPQRQQPFKGILSVKMDFCICPKSPLTTPTAILQTHPQPQSLHSMMEQFGFLIVW